MDYTLILFQKFEIKNIKCNNIKYSTITYTNLHNNNYYLLGPLLKTIK